MYINTSAPLTLQKCPELTFTPHTCVYVNAHIEHTSQIESCEQKFLDTREEFNKLNELKVTKNMFARVHRMDREVDV